MSSRQALLLLAWLLSPFILLGSHVKRVRVLPKTPSLITATNDHRSLPPTWGLVWGFTSREGVYVEGHVLLLTVYHIQQVGTDRPLSCIGTEIQDHHSQHREDNANGLPAGNIAERQTWTECGEAVIRQCRLSGSSGKCFQDSGKVHPTSVVCGCPLLSSPQELPLFKSIYSIMSVLPACMDVHLVCS